MNSFGVVLLLLACGGCLAEVVQDFNLSRCHKFFASPNGRWSPPTTFNGNQYRNICQTLNGAAEFATYYDTANRIPVYSAYRFTGLHHCSRSTSWFIEPQLDDQNQGGNMNYSRIVRKADRGKNQALNKDYAKSGYDKGHLASVYHASSQPCADATFTLTNAAPQDPDFNQKTWWDTEQNMANILSTNCTNKGLSAYVVTGVVPSQQNITGRVWVPSHFWTAYCCLDNNNVPRLSGGYYGINSNVPVTPMTVQQLERNLTNNYTTAFQVFGGRC